MWSLVAGRPVAIRRSWREADQGTAQGVPLVRRKREGATVMTYTTGTGMTTTEARSDGRNHSGEGRLRMSTYQLHRSSGADRGPAADPPEPLSATIAAQAEAFPTLGAEDLRVLEALGDRRSVAAGEYLYRAGDATYDFYAVVSGVVEIVVDSRGKEELVTRHRAGQFLGELNLLTGLRVFVNARVLEAGEVIAVPRETLRRLVATNPKLSDIILAAFLARRAGLLNGVASAIRVIGSRFSPETGRIREFLARSRIPHEWLDPDRDWPWTVSCRSFVSHRASCRWSSRRGRCCAIRRRVSWPTISASPSTASPAARST